MELVQSRARQEIMRLEAGCSSWKSSASPLYSGWAVSGLRPVVCRYRFRVNVTTSLKIAPASAKTLSTTIVGWPLPRISEALVPSPYFPTRRAPALDMETLLTDLHGESFTRRETATTLRRSECTLEGCDPMSSDEASRRSPDHHRLWYFS